MSADVFSDVVIRTKGKYDWRRAHHQHMKVHVALDAPASEAENMRMWSQYEVFMTAILPIPIDLCQLCFWIIRYQLISGSASFSHESMHGSLDSSILDLEVQMEALLGWTAPPPTALSQAASKVSPERSSSWLRVLGLYKIQRIGGTALGNGKNW